jgi:guanylate kinase
LKKTLQIARIIQPVIRSLSKNSNPVMRVCEETGLVDFIFDDQDIPLADAIWPHCIIALNKSDLCISALNSPLYEGTGWYAMRIADTMVRLIGRNLNIAAPVFAEVVPHLVLAIGGPSAAGKTTIAKAMEGISSGMIHRYTGYTSRPRRLNEKDGVDYHFRSDSERLAMQCDSRYDNFVEARGKWYWTCPGEILRGMWSNMDGVHIFFISKTKDFAAKKLLFPTMKWLWLEAPEAVIRSRLAERVTGDLEASVVYNRVLEDERNIRRPDMMFDTSEKDAEAISQAVLLWCRLELIKTR